MNSEKIEFGVFDHLDRTGPSLADYYEDRLKIAEAYDRAGFYGYHLAEHHATPLGMAPSPNVFLAALAQRTRRLRFGPMVFVLPLYHPLRLIEEICMLDQISGGRLEIGFGRGASPIELAIYGEDPDAAQEIYTEGLELILKGLTVKRLDFHGKHFSFDDVPMTLEPLQKPYPPIWYGVHAPDSAERAAKRNLQCRQPRSAGRDAAVDRALSRDVAAAASGRRVAEARPRPFHRCRRDRRQGARAGAARLSGVAPKLHLSVPSARPAAKSSAACRFRRADGTRPGRCRLAGDGVGVSCKRQLAETQCNYVVGQFAFGDMTREEALGSIGLFVSNVMPALRAADAEAMMAAR